MTDTALDTAYRALLTGGEPEALQFYRLLADAPLCLMLAEEAAGEAISPQVFDLSDGPVILAFDSEERLAAFQDGPSPYAILPGRVIAQAMAGQGLHLGLNLGSGAASETLLPPEALDHLLGLLDVSPEVTEAQARSFAPPMIPEQLDTALAQAMHGAAGVLAAAVLAGVTYENGAKGHILGLIGADAAAQPPLARAMAEALSFAGLEAAALDVVFLAEDDPVAARMARVGRVYEIPALARPEPVAAPVAPGSDPARPPRLR